MRPVQVASQQQRLAEEKSSSGLEEEAEAITTTNTITTTTSTATAHVHEEECWWAAEAQAVQSMMNKVSEARQQALFASSPCVAVRLLEASSDEPAMVKLVVTLTYP